MGQTQDIFVRLQQLKRSNDALLTALRDMVSAWQEQFGEDACDCMPEPQNFGHVCTVCRAKLIIDELENRA